MTYRITGGEVLIDKEDYQLVSTLKWHIGDTGYAVWRGVKDGKKQTIRMHRLITSCPKGKIVDHINHNPLDNRRSNLRICTHSDNMRNKKDQGRGYNWHKQNSSWSVETFGFRMSGFKTEKEAKEVVELIRAGGTYIKPERTECKHGHSLADAYIINGKKMCKKCQAKRSREYFKRSYKPKPRKEVRYCPRGHDKRITKTSGGDCSECAKIRSKLNRSKRL